MMNTQKKEIVILYVKNNFIQRNTISKQTNKLRDKTNEKIRILGEKYYIIKNIFDKFKFKRDDLFLIAMDLVKEYKNIKQDIRLQTQIRRMKEALICWFCEFFYDEIVEPNSIILSKMIEKTNIVTIFNNQSNNPPIKTKIHTSMQTNTQAIPTEKEYQTNISEIKTNQEADSFDLANLVDNENTNSKNNLIHNNENFNFESFFNF